LKKAIIVSGYFNPIHKGHIEYFNNAKANGDKLIVIVNSDHQRALKGSKEFLKEEERVFIVSNIKSVDQVFLSIDQDRTVCATIKLIHENYQTITNWLLPMGATKTTTPSQKCLFVMN
jgi:cytidyltransferase-like protein